MIIQDEYCHHYLAYDENIHTDTDINTLYYFKKSQAVRYVQYFEPESCSKVNSKKEKIQL